MKFGCLPFLVLVVVIITILIIATRGDDNDEQNSPAPTTVATTLASTTTEVTTPGPTTPATPTTVVVATPPELQELFDAFCVGDATFGAFEPTRGPNEGDSPPPIGSDNPALDVQRAGLTQGGCDADAGDTWVFLAELGGSPEGVEGLQIGLGLDSVLDQGFTANPTAPDGLGRAGEWDRLIIVNPDGSLVLYDDPFNQIAAGDDLRYEQRGNYVGFAFHERLIQNVIVFYFQVFMRDGNTGSSPIDWIVAAGQPSSP